jgi:hypothetical protein
MKRIWFFGDSVFHARNGAKRTVVPPRKYRGNPVMDRETPWEGDNTYEWPTVLYDEEDGLFKVWYECVYARTHRLNGRTVVAYATSADGLHWDRPTLNHIAFKGSKKNNIVLRGQYRKVRGKCVNVCKRGPGDFHLFYWDAVTPTTGRGVIHYTSPDGIHWTMDKASPVIQTPIDRTQTGGNDDVLRVSWDPAKKRFLLAMRTMPLENLDKPGLQKTVPGGFSQRRISMATSTDGRKWSKLKTVLTPRMIDPPEIQFYALSPFRFEDTYLGWLQIFKPEGGHIDIELAWSPDGMKWERVVPGETYLPNGTPPAHDSGLIHPVTEPILVGDQLYLYYWATNDNHSGFAYGGKKKEASLYLARAEASRQVCLVQGKRPGHFMLKPMKIGKGDLMVDADARKGQVTACVRDADTFHPVKGYTFDDCIPATGNGKGLILRWKKDRALGDLAGKTVVLHVRFEGAKMYSMAINVKPNEVPQD